METNLRRFLGAILALLMVVSMMPATVFAVETKTPKNESPSVEKNEPVIVESVTDEPTTDDESVTVVTTANDLVDAVTNYVAQIGDQGYTTLQAAIAEAQEGQTITLLESTTLTEALTIPADAVIILDLNGKTVSYTSTTQGEAMFTNKGTLTINDETGKGKIICTYEGAPDASFGKGNYTIVNSGTLTVNGGTIEMTSEAMSHMRDAIDNNSTSGNAVLEINGGKIVCEGYIAIRQFANSTTYENTIIVNDGEILGGVRAIWAHLPGSSATSVKKLALYVNGGTLTCLDEEYNQAVYVYSYGDSAANTIVKVTNGTLNGDIAFNGKASLTLVEGNVSVTGGTFNGAYGGIYGYEDISFGFISGGTFAVEPDAVYLAQYYEAVQNENGLWVVSEHKAAQIGDKTYPTLQDAINAAKDGDVITLLSTITLTESLVLNTEGTITIDGHGNTITTASNFNNTQVAAWMLGASTYGDAEAATHNYIIKNVVFDGVQNTSVIRAQGVTLTMDNCEVKNTNDPKRSVIIRLDYTEATIKNSKFENNGYGMVVVHNYNVSSDTGSQTKLTIDECVFSNNTVNLNSAVVYYVEGGGCTITNSEFVGNVIEASVNTATLYLGFQSDCVVTGNLFKDNVVNNTGTTTRVAGAIFFGYEADISGNAFINNTASNANGDALGQVCTSTYYECAIDLSGNYWGGNMPVMGVDYTVQHQTGDSTFALNDYYTTCEIDAAGNVVLSGKTAAEHVAQVGKFYYTSLQDAIDAAVDGDVINLYSSVTVTETITIDKDIKLYLNGCIVSNDDANINIFETSADVTIINGIVCGSRKTTTNGLIKVVSGNLTLESVTVYNSAMNAVRVQSGASVALIECTVTGMINAVGSADIYGGTYYGVEGSGITTKVVIHSGTFYFEITEANCVDGWTVVEVGDGTWVVIEKPYIAEVNGVQYKSLQDAINAAGDGDIVTLLMSCTGEGLIINKNITLNLNSYIYTLNTSVGSSGTETNGLQILPEAGDPVIMNGTIAMVEDKDGDPYTFFTFIKNYANLTLQDVTLDCNYGVVPEGDDYFTALNVTAGDVVLTGSTSITYCSTDGFIAIYVADNANIEGGASVTIDTDMNSSIDGIFYTDGSENATITIVGGRFTLEPDSAYLADGVSADVIVDGYYVAHVHNADDSGVTIEPGCTTEGELSFFCTICGTVMKTESIEATDHTMGDWEVTKAPTYDEAGEERRDCEDCDYFETKVIAKLIRNGWFKDDDGWFYYKSDVKMTGWQKVKDAWYYLNANGVMQTGWHTVDGVRRYFGSDGAAVTAWTKDDGKWYYLNIGAISTGWIKVNDIWYYLDSEGVMQTGWEKINGTWYYMDETGAMQTGWEKVNGTWYYMDETGAMQTGWLKVGGYWYYLSESGAMLTGTHTIDGKTYTFNASGVWVA